MGSLQLMLVCTKLSPKSTLGTRRGQSRCGTNRGEEENRAPVGNGSSGSNHASLDAH